MSARTRRRRCSRSAGHSDRPVARRPAQLLAGVLAAACVLPLAGCGSPPGVAFRAAEAERVWPAPPDPARIRFVGQIVSAADPRTGLAESGGMLDTLLGKKESPGMVNPMGVFSEGSRVFIADTGLAGIHVFDLESEDYAFWSPPEDGPRLVTPVGLAVAGNGDVLVADSGDGSIFVFDTDGRLRGTLGEELLRRPVGIAVDPSDGRIIVADAESHTVHALAPDGAELARTGGRGVQDGQFNYPTYVALDAEGRVFVSDSLNFRVQVFDRDLGYRRSFGSKGDLPGYFAQPKGLAVDGAGRVYVADSHFEAVQVFDETGRLLMTFGGEGRGPGEFWLPTCVHIDAKGRIWIADSYNRRVQVFEYIGPESAAAGMPGASGETGAE
jgi:DNA-binding beta-propeller fold protein YncE